MVLCQSVSVILKEERMMIKRKIFQGTNENSKKIQVSDNKRGKMGVTKSRFILVLHLIG